MLHVFAYFVSKLAEAFLGDRDHQEAQIENMHIETMANHVWEFSRWWISMKIHGIDAQSLLGLFPNVGKLKLRFPGTEKHKLNDQRSLLFSCIPGVQSSEIFISRPRRPPGMVGRGGVGRGAVPEINMFKRGNKYVIVQTLRADRLYYF